MSRRMLRAAVLVAVVMTTSLAATASAIGSGAAPAGRRVTVALFGDSVTESYLIPDFLQKGLAPQISDALAPFGYVPGGVGLIPAAPYRWHFNQAVQYGTAPSPPNGWTMIGYGIEAGFDGPSGYSAVATSPQATATATVTAPDLQVLFTSTGVHCTFAVTGAGHTWTIDTYRPGPNIDAAFAITVPPGRHELTIHGPSCGLLSFDGVIAQAPVTPGKVQVEVDDLGHAAELPGVDLTPRVIQLVTAERYNVSVFLWGYLAELFVRGRLPQAYVQDMTIRAQIARAYGGSCLIVQPTPIQTPQSQVTSVSQLDQLVAKRAGCEYTTVLAHLWPSSDYAIQHGLLLIDGVHPTAKGYTLIAHALAPVIAKLVAGQLRHPAGPPPPLPGSSPITPDFRPL